ISAGGMVTVTGGKWTTYRAMAESVLQHCIASGLLPTGLPACRTSNLSLVGAGSTDEHNMQTGGNSTYGNETDTQSQLPGAQYKMHADTSLTEAMIRFAVRFEYARTVEDVLARRSRILFLDAALAIAIAPSVAAIVQEETGSDAS